MFCVRVFSTDLLTQGRRFRATQVVAAARVPEERWVDKELYQPSHNLTPGAYIPVLIKGAGGNFAVQSMRWGLVPSYTPKDAKHDFWRMFNARRRARVASVPCVTVPRLPISTVAARAGGEGRLDSAHHVVFNVHRQRRILDALDDRFPLVATACVVSRSSKRVCCPPAPVRPPVRPSSRSPSSPVFSPAAAASCCSQAFTSGGRWGSWETHCAESALSSRCALDAIMIASQKPSKAAAARSSFFLPQEGIRGGKLKQPYYVFSQDVHTGGDVAESEGKPEALRAAGAGRDARVPV